MFGTQDYTGLVGRTVYSTDGKKLGELRQVYVDNETEQLQFITVNTGLFGTSENFVPAAQAGITDDGVTVPYDKDTIKNAPKIDADGQLSPAEEQEIYAYYGLAGSGVGTEQPVVGHDAAGYDTAGYGTTGHETTGHVTSDQVVTRSEEQLHVGTELHESGRVRLRKWVETEQQELTVPVTRERAVLERHPVTDVGTDHALSGKAISEEVHEVVLHEEVPFVEKTVTPVEQVRLDKEVVTEHQTVVEEVRKEHVEVDGDDVDPR